MDNNYSPVSTHASILLTFLTIFFLLYYFFTNYWSTDLTFTKSTRDNQFYLVRNLPDKIEAANRLSYIREVLEILINRLIIAYPNDKQIKLMKKRFRPDKIEESSQFSKYTSYSVNKGERLVFCLREKNPSQKLSDMNTIMFVALHELAHIFTLEEGHTKGYWKNFRFLLDHAIKWNVYKYVDYSIKKQKYCGIIIKENAIKQNEINKNIAYDETKDFSELPFPQTYKASTDYIDSKQAGVAI